MDPVRLREIAIDLLQIPDVSEDFRYFVERMAMCLSDVPLTLDRAVEVMGREPDETSERGTRLEWEVPYIIVCEDDFYGVRGMVLDKTHINPTVGQFACLVLAAKQGVTK